MIGEVQIGGFSVFGANFWRSPHDPNNPEAGFGLAAEFGCGQFGASCKSVFGSFPNGVSNGVLGYTEAADGEPFLKVGVGQLLKGSATPPADDYSPFSSYTLATFPKWHVRTFPSSNTVEMSQEALLPHGKWGYRLTKLVTARMHEIIIETELTNIGSRAFSMPHYSHNFLSVDNLPIGPPLQVALVPDVMSRNEPLVAGRNDGSVFFSPSAANAFAVTQTLSSKAKVKFEFLGAANVLANSSWRASFGSRLTVSSQEDVQRLPLYAYNLYAERTTLSPEPMQLISLGPGQQTSWRRQVTFSVSARDLHE